VGGGEGEGVRGGVGRDAVRAYMPESRQKKTKKQKKKKRVEKCKARTNASSVLYILAKIKSVFR
jgi:hypothetical protein